MISSNLQFCELYAVCILSNCYISPVTFFPVLHLRILFSILKDTGLVLTQFHTTLFIFHTE